MSYGKTLKLTPSGDLYLNEFRQLVLIEGLEKVQQDLKVILTTIKGDNIFDRLFGLDMLTIVRGKTNRIFVVSAIQAALKNYKYLKSIDSITVGEVDEQRKLSVNVAVTTTDDEKLLQSVVI